MSERRSIKQIDVNLCDSDEDNEIRTPQSQESMSFSDDECNESPKQDKNILASNIDTVDNQQRGNLIQTNMKQHIIENDTNINEEKYDDETTTIIIMTEILISHCATITSSQLNQEGYEKINNLIIKLKMQLNELKLFHQSINQSKLI